jgi:hypothetical protein
MQVTGQSWVVWQLSHSAGALGLVAMLGSLPSLLLAPWVGSWADRLDRRRLLTATALSSAILAFTLALITYTGVAQLWHIFILATLLGIVTALDNPAQNAFLGDLGGVTELHKSYTLNAIGIQVARMVGPAIAGWVIAAIGVSSTFWLNGLSYVAVIYSLYRVQAHQVRQKRTSNPLQEFGDGLAFMKKQPRIADLIAFTGIIVLLGFSNTQIFPAFVTSSLHGGPQALGMLLSSFGAGALVSATLLVPMCQRVKRMGWMLTAVLVWSGFWFFSLSMSTSLGFAMVSLFFAAFGQPVAMTTAKAMIQLLSPATMWGRLLSVQIMVSTGLGPFASLGTGYGAQFLGAPLAIRGNSILIIVCSLLLLFLRPGLKGWEISVDSARAPRSVPAER